MHDSFPIDSGIYYLKNGTKYEGPTNQWQLTGIGKISYSENSFYRGELLNGIKHGIGYEITEDGT